MLRKYFSLLLYIIIVIVHYFNKGLMFFLNLVFKHLMVRNYINIIRILRIEIFYFYFQIICFC